MNSSGDLSMRYQATLFLDASNISAEGANVVKLMNAFMHSNLIMLPGTVNELTPIGVVQRMRFASPEGNLEINIATNRIDVYTNNMKFPEDGIESLEEFCATAIKCFAIIASEFPRKANRLALVEQTFLGEMNEDNFAQAYAALFKAPDFYKNKEAFEWVNRVAIKETHKIEEAPELFHIISTTSRLRGEVKSPNGFVKFERIMIETDVNTSPDNTDTRFNPDSWDDFAKKAIELNMKSKQSVVEAIRK